MLVAAENNVYVQSMQCFLDAFSGWGAKCTAGKSQEQSVSHHGLSLEGLVV